MVKDIMSENGKIAFLCHPYHRGGVTRWMADAALWYAAKGLEVYFVTPEPVVEFYSGKGRETMLQLLTKTNNSVRKISTRIGREFEFGLPEANAYVYKKLLLENVPPGTPIILSDDRTVWEAATALHASYPIVGVLHADEGEYYRLASAHYKEVDVFVCVSARVNRVVQEKLPVINKETIFTIPCGIQLPKPEYRYNGVNKINMVYVGRITEYQKRTGDLVKVAALMKQKNIPFHLNIIGDGGATKIALEEKVKAENLNDCITFLGWLSQQQVHQYLLDGDVLILTSDFEGMPIAMMEGLASGCGFVGTRVSGIEDFEFHPLAKDCFGVFNVGDIEEAVKQVEKIAAVLPQTRKESARKLAESQFSMETCLTNYSKAIATIPARKYVQSTISLGLATGIKSRLTAFLRSTKMAMKK